MSHDYTDPFNPWAAAHAATEYFLDAWQRAILINPWMSWIKVMAEVARENVRPASPGNPFVQLGRGASRRIVHSLDPVQSLDLCRDAHDDGTWFDGAVRESTCA